ncbi:MAG: methyltransferase domain-containing protein, partial [Rhodothermales bacterium]
VEQETVDVVISNCVLNLVPNKDQAFREMHRVLRAGGHFCVSDVVATGAVPPALKRSAELYAGCVAGVIEQEAYLDKLRAAGFADVRIVQQKPIDLPDEVLLDVLSPEDVARFRESGVALRSVTVYGERGA